MKIDVVAPRDLGPGELAAWSRIQEADRDLASPFLSAQFTTACARIRPRTRVAVISAGGGVTGFLPFHAGRAGMGKALGLGFSDVQGLVAPPAAEIDGQALLAACGLRMWEFDHLLAWQQGWWSGAVRTWVAESSPVIDLADGWNAYEQVQREASNSLLQSTARKLRKLEREQGPVSLTFSEPDHALLEQLLTWKSEQYRRTGARDVFAAADMRRLVHDLLDVEEPGFSAPLTVLRAGGQVVAMHLGLRSETTLAWWFPVYAPQFAQYSPGILMCLETLRAMEAQGLRLLDLGKGDEPYKQRLSNAATPLLCGTVSSGRVTAGLDAARRWPRAAVKSFVMERPRVRHWAGQVRGQVASVHAQLSREPDKRW
jgi:CelD/BcsL family acetyltransferase involved in cellulose biosynthesis